jgi:hypothetical protein
MHAQLQKWLLAIGIAALIASESAGMQSVEMPQTPELADAIASLEGTAETLAAKHDYAQASKAYFVVATAWSEIDHAEEACAALSKSLDYYRKSVGEDAAPARDSADDRRDALSDIRARFGCASRAVADAR